MTTSTSNEVLLIAPVMDNLLARLEAAFVVHRLYEQEDAAAFLAEKGAAFRAVVTRGDIGVETPVLEQLPNLGLIAVFGVGTDAIDLNYTRKHGIAVTITSGALTEDVADMALGLLLATARQLCHNDRFVREGHWLKEAPGLSVQVSGKRLGIFGMGNIGRAIAQRAAGFNMRIQYASRTQDSSLPYRYFPDLLALARESDFFIIAISGGKDSAGLVDKAVFDALPSHALVINIARGSIVNEPNLITALQSGAIAGAGLDVYAHEPEVSAELIAMENVVLQPHIASATQETRQKMSDIVFTNVEAFFNRAPLPHAIE
ncbi:Glyoxylate/hydroxypyruvate reductase B [Serratia liquefaciens]|uniref:2-hydroxyacid dehydrogenase n=1 Tax=Serratia liquefaciens TaxID=614 RepID=UPI000D513334|nr:2-hydroxyacid dehydrogenase [Serratia liquefaciens]PVD44190.1 dihydrofolate reductase [Serratia liquefaciens]QHT51179.1 2-hydroxyacid dehydrogenase [Serratia liquefaciens]CAI0869282.1 Glyoxylate/hydroxypyruvate reductase B [Serratia liquefaciens]CAI0875111.1 Glyoxylate/hydroxypyruvate reductase B [Serratia liquefaciens]CAI1705439.1 Glyoxylate/hydroxypyruvate reductase B [Serratia liquefaciens]